MDEASIFVEALKRPSPAERAAFLDRACGGNDELRHSVELLLRAHDKAGGFLADSPAIAGVTVDPPVTESAGTAIGPYKLIEQIGEGGMGAVWMAQQTAPVKRLVAVKLIKAGMDSKQVIARFEAERQALALMDHPNIARVLDAGATPAGRPYFVMELVKGLPITRYCDERRMSLRERLELFVPVCQAVQHAHQKGIIHRDLKPSNVLVAPYDGVPVVKVIDFGVAKAAGQPLTERTLATGFGAVVGTLEYMSPEQAELNNLDIDTRSDIYALGVLLYELLTGTPPLPKKRLESAAFAEVLRIIREEEPPRPSTRLSTTEELPSIAANRGVEPAKLTGLVRGELDWIVMRALEKDRNRRYETANGFALDVQRYLADEPVQACPPSVGYRLRKFARRNKGPVLAASLVLAVLVIGIVGTTWAMIRATHAEADAVREAGEKIAALSERTVALGEKETALATAQKQEILAKENAKTAKEQELLARRRFNAAQMNLAQQAWEIGHSARVLELLESLRPKFDQEDLRGFEWYYLWQQCHRHQRLSWRVRRDGVFSVALSPDGTMLASASRRQDSTVKVWNTTNGQERLTLRGQRVGIWCVAFSPDSKILASGAVDGTVKLWDPVTGQELGTIVCTHHPYGVRGMAFSPDGKTLATSNSDNNTATLWDLTTKKLQGILRGHGGETLGVAFSPDGSMLATSGTGDKSVKLWSWDGTTARERLTIPSVGWGRPLQFSPDSKTLATGKGPVDLYDVATGNKRASLEGHRGEISSLAFSPDGKTLASGSQDRTVRLWDPASGQERNQLPHLSPVHSVSFSADGKLLASGSVDGRVQLWELGAAEVPDTLKHSGAVRSLVFSQDGRTLASAGDHPTKLWDVATGKEKATIQGPLWSGAISQDGATLAALNPDKTIQACDLTTGKAKARFQAEPAGALSPDGATLVTFSPYVGKTVKLWNTATGQLRRSFQVRDLSVISVAFSPDGKLLATGGHIYEVSLWDAATGKEKLTFGQGESGFSAVVSLRFSPDGKRLATGSDHGTVRLRDATTGQLLAALKGHTQGIVSLAFAPDGGTLATASADQTVKLWDSTTGQERLTLKAGAVTFVAFAPNGKTLATANSDRTVKLWRGATDPEATALRDELDPDDPDSLVAMNALGDRLWKVGEPGGSATAYRKALARAEKLAAAFPESTEYRVELAYSLFAAAASLGTDLIPEQAHRQVREVCQKLPPEEQRALAHRYDELASQLVTDPDPTLRQPRRAVELANKAVELGPNEKTDWGTVWDTLGLACYRAGDWKGAVEALNKSRSLDVRNRHPDVRALFVLSMAYWKQGAKDEARKWYTLAIVYTEKRMPNRAEVPSLRREAAAVLELSAKAADLAPQALTDGLHLLALHLDVDPKAAWAYRDRGQIYFGQRNYDKAAADFAKVTDLKPLDPQAWFDRGVAHYRAGDWKAAIATLEKSMALRKGGDSNDWFFLAMAHWQLGQKDKARAWYHRAVQWMDNNQPTDEELRRFRAETSELLGVKEEK